MRLVKPRLRKERIPQDENSAECCRRVWLAACRWRQQSRGRDRDLSSRRAEIRSDGCRDSGASDLGGIIYVDDDQDYDNHYYGNQPNQGYNQAPYPQQNNNWQYPQGNNYGSQYGGYQGDFEKGWDTRGYNQWNQQYVQRRPLSQQVIAHKLRMHQFYNVQKIKAKKGYYKSLRLRPLPPPGIRDRRSLYRQNPARRTPIVRHADAGSRPVLTPDPSRPQRSVLQPGRPALPRFLKA